MQILGLLGIYFDAVVGEVKKKLYFYSDPGHTVTIFRQNVCVPDIVRLGDRSVLFHSMQNVEHL
jgi:hypothetical protein